MMRHLKPLVAMSLLFLTPAISSAEESTAEDFLAERLGHVRLVPGQMVQLPTRPAHGQAAPLGPEFVTQTYMIGNWTSGRAYSIGALEGVSVLHNLDSDLFPTTMFSYSGYGQVEVPSRAPWYQFFGYTTNPNNIYGQAKTCIWQVSVSIIGGACNAHVTVNTFGEQGATCWLSGDSHVEPFHCGVYLGLGIL
ncbi:hypothetical protein POL68_18555 [Stigmatella sp. ncwal1]|uniref:Uncharacterized protein n=1 Tax=Stigmatella ashevillensis TaxID=2995309 RepID=A0ABT5D9Y7_9BACT|nr:hypothetical protein [Stigmatella ashevillena]MDC0710485.1 hypothetical protein [Stigmatella ashevillena]